jgi:acyl CoA:acetate/3-ketoacid CoA transferase beta subunit
MVLPRSDDLSGGRLKGMGGAMDLVANCANVSGVCVGVRVWYCGTGGVICIRYKKQYYNSQHCAPALPHSRTPDSYSCLPTIQIIVTTLHTNKFGEPKILPTCTFPLTGRRTVSKIITELAVFEVNPTMVGDAFEVSTQLCLVEKAAFSTVEEIRKVTGAEFVVSSALKDISV